MSKSKTPIRFTGQHFTVSKQLITDAINLANLLPNDTVMDIGAGKGYLTIHLSQLCKKVIAIEKDRVLARILEKRFSNCKNVDVIRSDFRDYVFPDKSFKVVSNIPYGITSDILKSLMFQQAEFFSGGTIITQLEVAEKLFSGKLYNPYAILYHTFFDLRFIHEIPPASFTPPPAVMSALIQIRKKQNPMVQFSQKKKYLGFLFHLLRKPDIPARTALKSLFRKRQVRNIVAKYGIDPDSDITQLSPKEWANCFKELLDKVPEKYHPE
ncbi:23S ribosomal RNA methyltransferase Erm [Rhodohalobacter sp. 614A]|uniref:23S ribosomal RNA methyltransferase Erm n=1 Tax=Rhodohalobacter sp. 614A TaxID=2908649 RepID=UPI001F463BEB|nr:23S ribosomal RNA methyltransferase Erm [Rhodohalobacter sp. 614A]